MDNFSRSLAAAALIDGQHFSLPGCGTIEGIYVSAKINHVTKSVEPPSLEIRWTNVVDEQAQTFEDLLIHTGATTTEAQDIQNQWLATLESGSGIQLGDLGELKFDVDTQRIGFFPNEVGLNKAFWNSGALSLEPLDRREADMTASAAEVETTQVSTAHLQNTSTSTSEKGVLKMLLPYMAAAVVVVSGVLLFHSLTRVEAPDAGDKGQVVAVNHDRLNKSPREDEGASTDFSEDQGLMDEPEGEISTKIEKFDPENLGAVASDATEDFGAFDPAGLAGGDVDETGFELVPIELVIIVGSFGNSANAEAMAKKVTAAGFQSYIDQTSNMTRVGVSFSASNEQQVADMVQQMRVKFNPNAWLLE